MTLEQPSGLFWKWYERKKLFTIILIKDLMAYMPTVYQYRLKWHEKYRHLGYWQTLNIVLDKFYITSPLSVFLSIYHLSFSLSLHRYMSLSLSLRERVAAVWTHFITACRPPPLPPPCSPPTLLLQVSRI